MRFKRGCVQGWELGRFWKEGGLLLKFGPIAWIWMGGHGYGNGIMDMGMEMWIWWIAINYHRYLMFFTLKYQLTVVRAIFLKKLKANTP